MKTIDNDIKAGELKSAYLLFGEEIYLMKQYRNKLKNAMVSDGDTMNFSAYEGAGIDPNAIIDLAETMPFLAERRVILIENSGFFKKDGEELAEYLPTVPESTCFIFVESEVDKRSRIYKAIGKVGRAVEFKTQTDELIAKWVVSRIKKEGKSITNNAYNLFISKTGNDMENIDKEIEKLVCYCLEKEVIEVGDVEAITTEQIENKVFEMVDAITANRQKQALELYYDLLALKEPPMRIMYLITRQFRILTNVKSMSGRGSTNKEIAEKAGCPLWAVGKYQAQCRSYSIAQLKGAVRAGVEYEEAVKTGYMNDQMAVELFITQYSSKKIEPSV